MKFSSSLEFNAVPEWRSYYIDYAALKKKSYSLEKEAATARASVLRSNVTNEDGVQLLAHDPRPVFAKALDKELKKINNFYREQEVVLIDRFNDLNDDIKAFFDGDEEVPPNYESESDSDGEGLRRSSRPDLRDVAVVHERDERSMRKIELKRAITALYVSINELLSYIDLNKTGFRKILKKFDKIMGTHLQPVYTQDTLSHSAVFEPSAEANLRSLLDTLSSEYSRLMDMSLEEAADTLKGYLREHVVWERNTVWRDLISMERQKQAIRPEQENKSHRIHILGVELPRWVSTYSNPIRICTFLLIFLLMVNFPLLHSPPQNNCFAIVVLASLLWATESIPLFVTSLTIPFLAVILRVPLTPKGKRMSAEAAADFVFARMWSPVITVLLGGFALAAALSKYNIAKKLATIILSRSGSNPRVILLVLMGVSTFICMWISNVAAPVLMFSVAEPLLRTLPDGDSFGKAIILGIALASNIGGMASPIASPQNIIALQNMSPEPSWGAWFMVAIPVCSVSIILIWLLLIITFPPSTNKPMSLGHIRGTSDRFGLTHYYILAVTIFTIALWCFSSQLEKHTGNMGILALVPIVLLFGPGILSAADFNNFLWTIVALAMGGVALGKSVESCGLLKTAAVAIQAQIQELGLYGVCIVFGFMILIVASFVSHTVAALIVLPLVASIGEQMDDPHPNVLVMVSAFLCSAAMALPTSGFPNVSAICQTDGMGVPYLTVGDFITRGVPASVLCYLVIVTVGFVILRLGNF